MVVALEALTASKSSKGKEDLDNNHLETYLKSLRSFSEVNKVVKGRGDNNKERREAKISCCLLRLTSWMPLMEPKRLFSLQE